MSDFDYRGLKCPVPVIKAFNFKDLCDNTGLKLSKIIKEESYYLIVIERR